MEAASCSGETNDNLYHSDFFVRCYVLCAYVAGIRKRRRDKLFLSNSLVCFFPYFWNELWDLYYFVGGRDENETGTD